MIRDMIHRIRALFYAVDGKYERLEKVLKNEKNRKYKNFFYLSYYEIHNMIIEYLELFSAEFIEGNIFKKAINDFINDIANRAYARKLYSELIVSIKILCTKKELLSKEQLNNLFIIWGNAAYAQNNVDEIISCAKAIEETGAFDNAFLIWFNKNKAFYIMSPENQTGI
jgi:hypothetical protein